MKTLVSVALVLGLLFAPVTINARPDPPPVVATCIVGAIFVTVCGVLVYGVYKICQSAPPEDAPPAPVIPPDLEATLPPPGGMYIFRLPPKISMGWAMINEGIEIQHGAPIVSSGRTPGWQTDYSFRSINNYDGTMSMIASDANGVPLQTNTVPLINWNGQSYVFFDFSTLGSIPTNIPPAMFFRMATRR